MSNDILRPPKVVARTGLSRTTIWRLVKAGKFPAPLVLGENSIGWTAQSIEDWLESRPHRTYGAKTYGAEPEPEGA